MQSFTYVSSTSSLSEFSDKRYSSDNSTKVHKYKASPRNSPTRFIRDEYFDDTASSDGGKSSDEMDSNKVNTRKTSRKNSIITFSNVKRKISSTFHKRNQSPLAVRHSPHASFKSIHALANNEDSDSEKKKAAVEKKPKRRFSTNTMRHHSTNKNHSIINGNEDSDIDQKPKRRSSTSSVKHNRVNREIDKNDLNRRSSIASMKARHHHDDQTDGLRRALSTTIISNKKKLNPTDYDGGESLHHPALDRLKNTTSVVALKSASIPDIQSRSRANSFRPMKKFNIYLLGSRAVGKTALSVRFLTGRYIHEYKSMPEEVYTRVIKYDDEQQADVKIHVIDIETMEKDIELDCNSGIMILYSIIDESTYSDATFLLQYLTETDITSRYPVMFIGTKRDLSRLRRVSRKEACKLGNNYNCTQFEVSSATDKRVKDCFHSLFRQIEVRQILDQTDENDCKPAILNPTKIMRNGVVRYGTA